MKKVPLKPTKKETGFTWTYICVCCVVWAALVIASLHLIIYYFHQIFTQGLYDGEGMKMGVYIIAGSFLFLFIYRDEVRRIFKVKDVPKVRSSK